MEKVLNTLRKTSTAKQQLISLSSSTYLYKLESAGFMHVDRLDKQVYKHLMMGRGKRLSQDLCNKIVALHNNGTGYQRISQLLNVPVAPLGSFIHK